MSTVNEQFAVGQESLMPTCQHSNIRLLTFGVPADTSCVSIHLPPPSPFQFIITLFTFDSYNLLLLIQLRSFYDNSNQGILC